MRTLLFSLVCLIPVFFANGQGAGLRFARFDSSDGLSNNWVRCFYQDDSGLIWIGTSDSMDRYDGREIKSYRPTVNSGGRPLNVTVNVIAKKSSGLLWVGTDSGLFTYDQKLETFTHFAELKEVPVLHILEDSRGRFWISTSQGYWVIERNEEVRQFEINPNDPSSFAHPYANVTFEDAAGVIWIGTKAGLSKYNESSDSFTTYRSGNGPNDLTTDDVLRIAEDQQGRLWLATARGGLDLALRQESGEIVFRNVYSGKGIRLIVDRDNLLWLTMGSGGGLLRVDLDRFAEDDLGAIDRYGNELGNKWSLVEDSVFSVYEDHLGDIWIGTFGAGVNFYSKRGKQINVVREHRDRGTSPILNNKVTRFFEEDDSFWIGTMAGLTRRNKADGSVKHFQHVVGDETSLGADPIYSMLKDSHDNLWVGGWTTGLNRFDYERENFKRYMPDESATSIGSTIVYAILEDRSGNLWIGTQGAGLDRFDYETEEFEHFPHDPSDPTSIASNFVGDILETRSGVLYITTYNSLERWDPETGVFTHYRHRPDVDNGNSGGDIEVLFEDSSGRIWLGTTSGLEIFDEETSTFEVFGEEHGMPSIIVQGLLEDDSGNLWVSTSAGVSMFKGAVADPHTAQFRNITQEEGLSSDQFNKRAAWKGLDGTLYFGSSAGYTFFDPAKIEYNDVPAPVVLTEMLQLEPRPDSLLSYHALERNINSLKELELMYSNTSFVIKFASLNYLNSEKNQYRYRLDGYDKDWIDGGTSGSATYGHIPPGSYTFQVLGSNNDGIWSQKAKTLSIVVHPPWWRTLWFYVLCTLLLIGLLVAFYRIRFSILEGQRKKLKKSVRARTVELEKANSMLANNQSEIRAQNKELQKHRDHLEHMIQERTKELEKAKMKAEESDQLKSSFLMNMSHEVRTPMNAIIGFSSLLRDEKLSKEDHGKFIEVIRENGRSLLVLIDDILDISLIHSDQMRLSDETFFADKVLVELRDYYFLRNEKGLKIELINEGEPLELTTDPVRFRQVISNLLSNAYKYTDKGSIRYGFTVSGGEALFEVSDTGLGIDPEDQGKIFDHFYKVEKHNARLYPGTGIGLSICRKLVDKMGGRLWLESEPGKGSSFFFTLPIRTSLESLSRKGDELEVHDLSKATVLVAEDDPTNLDLIKYSLKKSDVNLHYAENGQEAVDFVAAHLSLSNLVILMDIKMPVMDGCEACRLIKEMKSEIPVVAITAYAQESDRERIMESGFDGFYTKPIESEGLISLVSEFTEK